MWPNSTTSSAALSRRPAYRISVTTPFGKGLRCCSPRCATRPASTPAARRYLYPRIVTALSQRLQVEDWYRRHPEIDDGAILPPLIGLGLPRTGSTALSLLLSQDPGHPLPTSVGVVAAVSAAVDGGQGPDPRIPEDDGDKVGSRAHVPTGTHAPMECLELMALDFKSHIFQAFAQIPSYSAWLVEKADLETTYAYQRRVMKLLQWGEPTRPWRLKSPSHVLWLDDLDRAFPDARFVMTHRDPTDVILSVADLYADIIGGFTDHIDREYIGQLNVEHWSLGMQRALHFRDGGADHRFYDIDFRAMQTDPINEVRGLYGWLGEPVSDEFESRMRNWWAEAAAEREPSTHADPVAFGIDLDKVRPLFADYAARSLHGS